MKSTKKFLAAVALALAFINIAAPMVSAAELRASETEERGESLDFSLEYSPRAYLSPSDLIMKILGETVAEAEAEYLDHHFEQYLIYATAIPDSLISLKREGDRLTVSAQGYSYIAENGERVVFLPVYATVGGVRYDLTADGDVYSAVVAHGDENEVRVFYNGSLPLPLATANRLLNFAFEEGSAAMSSSEYLLSYNKALSEYNKYIAALEIYENDLVDYNEYVSAKALYDKAQEAYEKNLKEIETYPARLEAYNKYRAENNKYLSDMEIYKTEYAAYEESSAAYRAYVTNLAAIRTALVPMESIFTKPNNGSGTLFRALQNADLIVMFEKYQSLLVNSFRVDAKDIRYMRQYSDRLNELIRQYSEKRDISEEEAFAFYKANYTEICSLFNGLYDKMESILTPTIFNLMCGKMEIEYGKELGEYKKWRVKNVLCHIYLICLCLDDTRTADSTWSFYGNDGDPHTYYFSDLLSQNLIITDTNASNPSGLSWKAPVEMTAAPVMPTRPTEVEKPIEPQELSEPTKPEEVKPPTEPVKVDKPTLPEDFDNELLLRTGDIMLLLADKTDPLTRREELSAPVAIDIELSVAKAVPRDVPTVTFYDREGNIIKTATDLTDIPEAEATCFDRRTEYTFLCYSTSPVAIATLPEELTEDISVYPIYTAKARRYKITFSMDGRITEREVAVGEYPAYGDIPAEKPSDELYDYTFDCFDTALCRVNGDAYYTATYKSSDRIFEIIFSAGLKTVRQRLVRGSEIENYPAATQSYIKGNTLYEFTGWDKPLETVSADTEYTALYRATVLASAEAAEPTVTEGMSELTLSGEGGRYELSELISLAVRKKKSLNVSFPDYGVQLVISLGSLRSLETEGVKTVELICDRTRSAEGGVAYSFKDEKGTSVAQTGGVRLRVTHGYESDGNITVRAHYENGFYSDNIASVTGGGITEIAASSDVLYQTVRKFTVTVKSGEHGNAFADKLLFDEGETGVLYVNPDSGYTCGGVKLINTSTGEVTELGVCRSFTVPSYNAEVLVEFVPVEYEITFIYHGRTEVCKYAFGETPVPPEIEMAFTENGFFYSFIGWSAPVSIVTDNATYTAKYFSISEDMLEPDEGSAIMGIIRRYVIPAAVITVILSAVAVGILWLMKKQGIIKKKIRDKR